MSREFTYLEEHDTVLVRTSGRYQLERETATLENALSLLQENNSLRCLFDHRATEVVAPTIGSYNRPELYASLGFTRKVRMAHLFTALTDDLKFYETVCVNRGWDVKVFTDYSAALDWLKR